MFRLDEAQNADVLLFLQELVEQTVAIVSGRLRSDVPGRSPGLGRFTASQNASNRQHGHEQREDGLRGHKLEVLTASDSLRTELKPP